MKFSSFLSVCGLVAASLGVVQAAPVRKIVPQGDTNFTSKAHGFAVWLPVKPIETRKSYRWWKVETQPFTQFYFVFDAPSKILKYKVSVTHKDPSNWLYAFTGSMVFVGKVKIKSQKREDIQLDQFQGVEGELLFADGKMSRSRAYSAMGDTYSISVSGPEVELQKQAAQITRVFDSFRILPQ